MAIQTQQNVDQAFGTTNSINNSYPMIVAGPAATPDYTKAIPYQGGVDIVNALSQLTGATNRFWDATLGKVQREEDNNARIRFEGKLSAYMSGFQPKKDDAEAKQSIDGIMEGLKTAADTETDASSEQRRQFAARVSAARDELAIRQQFGKAEIIAREAKNLWDQGLEQSIKTGDDANIDAHLKVAQEKGYIVKDTPEELHSRAALYGKIINQSNNLDIPRLNALSEQLTEDVDPAGNSTFIPGLKRNQNIEAINYIRNLKAEKVAAADAKLEEMARNNTLTPQNLEEQYRSGQLAQHQYDAFKKDFESSARQLYASQKEAAREQKTAQQQTMKDNRYILEEQIESVPWAVDAGGRKQQYEQMLAKINSGGFDPQHRVELKKVLERANKEFESGEHFKQDANYKMGVGMINDIRKNGALFVNVQSGDGSSWHDVGQRNNTISGTDAGDDYQNARAAELHTAFVSAYRQNPDQFKTPEAVQNFVKNRVAALNDGKIKNLIQQSYSAAPVTAGDMSGNQAQPRPQDGAIIGGFRYLGGDPKNKASWETVK